MDTDLTRKLYEPYRLMFFIYVLYIAYAFTVNSPTEIFHGIVQILKSPDLLITDYMKVGGVGAAFVNCAIIGIVCMFIMYRAGVKPNGATIMALWLVNGFSFFGKNIYNVWPTIIGVWLYSKRQKEPFINYSLVALLSTSVSPIVSHIVFLGHYTGAYNTAVGIVLGILAGIAIGFVFPIIAQASTKVHGGYSLYNSGFAAGIIATFFVAITRSFGVTVETTLIWMSGNNFQLAIFVYSISLILIIYGIYLKKGDALEDLKKMTTHTGRLVTDFYILYQESSYINMGVLGILATTIVLVLGADLNGPTIGGIFTIMGHGCFGKHIKNITPIILGSLLSVYLNAWHPTFPSNILAILFSTCLAPIAGQFGPGWGILAGFLHVHFVLNITYLQGGLNLYNNGFAAGFVAFALLPVIQAFRKDQN